MPDRHGLRSSIKRVTLGRYGPSGPSLLAAASVWCAHRCAKAARDRTPTFRIAAARCFLTVLVDKNNASAISALVRPVTANSTTSRSRGVIC